MRLQGYNDQIIGLVMSANYLGILLGIFFCQKIVQQVGHIRAFAVFAAVMTAVSLVHGLYMSAWLWAMLRICNGLCVLMPLTICFGMVFTIYPVAMARAQDNIEKEDIVPVSAALRVFPKLLCWYLNIR